MILDPFISLTGITKRELPKDTCPSGIFIMSIPGLCAGGNAYPRKKAPVYVTFVRAEKSMLSGKTSEQRNIG